MRVQFSSIFLILFTTVLVLLPLSRPPYHWPEVVLAAVLAAFFFSRKQWSYNRLGQAFLRFSLVLVAGVVAAALLANPLGDWLYVSRLSLVFLALPLVAYLVNRYGVQLISVVGVGVLLLHAQWGVVQFALQTDLGLTLLGESILSSSQPAVAKFSWGDVPIVRAYGPYPHANTFGGAMLVALVLLGWLKHTYLTSSRSPFFTFGWLLSLLALLVSFSRSAYAGVGVLVLLLVFSIGVRWKLVSLMSFILLLVISPLLWARFTDVEDRAAQERMRGYEWWAGLVRDIPLWRGYGPGKYPEVLESFLVRQHISHEPWEVAPVHSVPLLLVAEWGLALPAALGLLLRRHLAGAWRLLPLAPALLLDHYFLTQPSALLWLLVVLVTATQYSRPIFVPRS